MYNNKKYILITLRNIKLCLIHKYINNIVKYRYFFNNFSLLKHISIKKIQNTSLKVCQTSNLSTNKQVPLHRFIGTQIVLTSKKMGSSQSFTSGLTSDRLEEYETLTYLSKSEILYLLKKFYSISPNLMDADFNHRFHKYEIMTKFPVLKYNPFRDRLFRVFSSQQDDCFSFEDMLDLCSAMSDACPPHVKASWAFKVFDMDEDNQVGTEDISSIIDRLVWDRSDPSKHISTAEKEKVAKVLLDDMDLRHIGSLGMSEFTHAMSKVEEFSSAFYFRL